MNLTVTRATITNSYKASKCSSSFGLAYFWNKTKQRQSLHGDLVK